MDILSLILAKKGGNGEGSRVGWTKKNANNIVAVIESLPEEIMIEGKRQTALYGLDDADFDIWHTRLVYLPEKNCYEGYCMVTFFSGSDLRAYFANGFIRLELDENYQETETNFYGECLDGDGLRMAIEFAIDLSALTLVAYKGTPVEIPTYTVTINNTSSPDTYGEGCASYSIDGGNTWIKIDEPNIVVKDVSEIWLKDNYGYGGYINDKDGNTLAFEFIEPFVYKPTEDTTLELYISW